MRCSHILQPAKPWPQTFSRCLIWGVIKASLHQPHHPPSNGTPFPPSSPPCAPSRPLHLPPPSPPPRRRPTALPLRRRHPATRRDAADVSGPYPGDEEVCTAPRGGVLQCAAGGVCEGEALVAWGGKVCEGLEVAGGRWRGGLGWGWRWGVG